MRIIKAKTALYGLMLGLLLLAATTTAGANPVQFNENGHYYEFVPDYAIPWDDAKTAAELKSHLGVQGHLATVTTTAEHVFLHDVFSQQIDDAWDIRKDGAPQAWLGGFSPAPHSTGTDWTVGWQWITGETWDYVGWGGSEPNGGTSSFSNVATIDLRYALGGWNDTFAARMGLKATL